MTTVAELHSGHAVRSSTWFNRFKIAAIVQDALLTGFYWLLPRTGAAKPPLEE